MFPASDLSSSTVFHVEFFVVPRDFPEPEVFPERPIYENESVPDRFPVRFAGSLHSCYWVRWLQGHRYSNAQRDLSLDRCGWQSRFYAHRDRDQFRQRNSDLVEWRGANHDRYFGYSTHSSDLSRADSFCGKRHDSSDQAGHNYVRRDDADGYRRFVTDFQSHFDQSLHCSSGKLSVYIDCDRSGLCEWRFHYAERDGHYHDI